MGYHVRDLSSSSLACGSRRGGDRPRGGGDKLRCFRNREDTLFSGSKCSRRRFCRGVFCWFSQRARPHFPEFGRDFYPAGGAVRILVPFAAGGPTDVVARILAEQLSARWGGRTVMVENRPGAGTIVMTSVAKAPPDGLTLGLATNSLLINPAIGMKLPYDTFREVAGVSMVATQPVALVANKAFPANTLGGGCCACEASARAAELHLARAARRRASGRRTAAAEGRHPHEPHQLQRQRAGADRRDRRARAADVRHLAFGATLC